MAPVAVTTGAITGPARERLEEQQYGFMLDPERGRADNIRIGILMTATAKGDDRGIDPGKTHPGAAPHSADGPETGGQVQDRCSAWHDSLRVGPRPRQAHRQDADGRAGRR